MKIIKVSTELEMSVHEFPSGTIREHNKALCELIGNGCDLVEHVMPKRLYTELKMPSSPVKEPGKCVSMLIDEEGRLKTEKFCRCSWALSVARTPYKKAECG